MAVEIDNLGRKISNESEDIAERMRSCFMLKSIGLDRPELRAAAIDALALGYSSQSVLLKHEVAYVMGQMGDTYANAILEKVLRDEQEDPVVRHEAAEALAAIGSKESLPILEEFEKHKLSEISDTCQIAVSKLKWQLSQGKTSQKDEVFGSVDPAPADDVSSSDIPALQERMNDSSLPLFKRYRAMFSLRNLNSEESVKALCSGFNDPSAVFRHEIAFVLGQMMHPASIAPLRKVLEKQNEHEMVRHEAAEALGAISSQEEDGETVNFLKEYAKDPERIVRESCAVALDIHEYWTQGSVAPN